MDKIRRRAGSKIRRKSAAGLTERKTKPVNKCQSTAVYQATALLLFVILGLFIYSNTLKSPFVFDDGHNIRQNRHIRLTELALKDIVTAGFKSPSSNRPIANITFALNYYFHQYNLIGYHCTNIIIHILTGIFLFLFVKNTLATPSLCCRYERYKWIPFFAAFLWLVHPLQTQSVTYIVQRMTSLAAMFYILSLLLYVKGRLTGQGMKESWLWFAGCIIAGILSLGCKETAAVLPVFILLYEWYFFRDLNIPRLKRYLPYVIGVFIIFGLLGLWFLGSSPLEKILSGYDQREFTLTERLLTQPRVVIYYISLLAYPHPGRLNLDYDFTISRSFIAPPTTLLCTVAVIGLIIFSFYIAKRQRLLSFCILWFFGNLAIESSFLPLELVFEHRLYLPSMFVSLAIVALAWRYIKQKWIRVVVFCIVTVLCCGWTYERNKVWKDPLTLWSDCVAKSPEKARPHNNLGNALQAQDKLDEAISHFRRALQLKPDFVEALSNLGNALQLQGKLDEAISCYRQALLIDPHSAKAFNNLGSALQLQGELDEAIDYFRQALRNNPDSPKIHYTHYNLAKALDSQGNTEEAISHYRHALRIKPDFAEACYNLGRIMQTQGNLDEAINYYHHALRFKPDFAEAHNNLGSIMQTQGRFDEAISHFRQALQLDSGYAEPHYNLGSIMQAHGRLDEAISHYRQALQLKPDHAKAHSNLATALSAQDKLDEAISHFRQSLRIAPDSARTHNNMGHALKLQGKLDEAISHYRQALQVDPNYAPAHNNLGNALRTQFKFNEAVNHFQQALRIAPNSAKTHNNLANVLTTTGQLDEALKHSREAVRLKPDYLAPLNRIAKILATHPDPKLRDANQAIELAERAAKLTKYQNPTILDTLAAAYAAAGQFDRAVTTAQAALTLASAAQADELANRIRKRLELYRQAKP
jgi:tetratricopeptide (TPR) repeat protein